MTTRTETNPVTDSTIIYTYTDEAPALATASFLPIVQAITEPGGGGCRDARHLARGARAGGVPAEADARAAGGRRARRARRTRDAARGEHHQAPEHLGVDPAAEGRHRRTAGGRLRHPGLPRRAADARGEGHPRPLRPHQGLRGQPRAARGQQRPPRAAVGEELRAQAPAPQQAVRGGIEDARRDARPRRLQVEREVRRHRRATTSSRSSTSPPTAPSRRSRPASRCCPARSSTRRSSRPRRSTRSSPRRCARPQPTTSSTRCTSRRR